MVHYNRYRDVIRNAVMAMLVSVFLDIKVKK
jgi:hypothetical protein